MLNRSIVYCNVSVLFCPKRRRTGTTKQNIKNDKIFGLKTAKHITNFDDGTNIPAASSLIGGAPDIALWAINQNGEGQGPIRFNPKIAERPVPFKDGYPTVNNQYNTATKFDIECKFENGIIMNVVSHR
jgi:hypothetical protein